MACGVAVVPDAKKWVQKLYGRRHGQIKLTVSVHLHCSLLLSYDRTWTNVVQFCRNWYQTNVEQCSWHEEKQTGVLSHLAVQNVIMVWDTSWWCRAHIEQNMKSCTSIRHIVGLKKLIDTKKRSFHSESTSKCSELYGAQTGRRRMEKGWIFRKISLVEDFFL
jgi:hypothetical protein